MSFYQYLETTIIVSFDLSGHPSGFLQQLRVEAAGQFADFFFQAGVDPINLDWQTNKWLFTANASETTLELYSLQTFYEFGGPALDNVSVSAIPEPTTVFGTFVSGAIVMAWKQQRNRKSK